MKTVVLLLASFLAMVPSTPAAAVSSYSFVRNWGSLGSGTTNFNNPTGIAVDAQGRVIVALRNGQILCFGT